MSFKIFDFAIIGQGIAGTLLAYFLKKHGKSVLVIDNNFEGASSKVAAGIVNPITGKKFVKSWRVDEFLPFAYDFYIELGKELRIETLTKTNIIRTLDTIEDENNWLARTADLSINSYMLGVADISELKDKVINSFGYGEIQGTFYVKMGDILEAFKQRCISESCYYETKFDYQSLKKGDKHFEYKDAMFHEIVFCEGYQALQNPYFKNIGLAPSKGEVLMVKIPGAGFKKMYKNKIFIIHQFDDIYWVGSGYEWNATNDRPTQKSYNMLAGELERVLTIPYEIMEHKAAIRPTMHSRRPIFIVNEELKGMYLFNGLGTKGASIGPFAADQFSRFLIHKNPNDLILQVT